MHGKDQKKTKRLGQYWWNKKQITAVLAVAVALGTIGSLTLPAVTLSKNDCSKEEHIHTEECYTTQVKKVLACTYDSPCIHSHDEMCYDEDGTLVCKLTEVLAHEHSDECWAVAEKESETETTSITETSEQVHVHTDECYEWIASDIANCGLEVEEGHKHNEQCYATGEECVCGLDESLGHKHSDNCYMENDTIICGIEEFEGHKHTSECYITTQTVVEEQLVCEIAESEGHKHSEACHQVIHECTCTLEESEGHKHNEACHQLVNELTCTLEESDEHQHGSDCYTEVDTIICELEEADGHQHSSDCYTDIDTIICGLEESDGHIHSSECYIAAQTLEQEQLVCELEESEGHKHSEACHHVSRVLACTLEETDGHTHGESCFLAAGTLVCELKETEVHTHSKECYPLVRGELICTEETSQEQVSEEETTEEVEKELICTHVDPEVHQHGEECFIEEEVDVWVCKLTEHIHVNACFPNKELEVETAEQWEALLPETISENWVKAFISVARTQLGYTESATNKIKDESGEIKGYTRFGDLVETPYNDWQATFLSFCLSYANIPEEYIPHGTSVGQWEKLLNKMELLVSAEEREPEIGDIVFLDRDGDGSADTVGILAEALEEQPVEVLVKEEKEISEVSEEENVEILSEISEEENRIPLCTIEGDFNNSVAQVEYDAETLLASVSLASAKEKYVEWLTNNPSEKPFQRIHRGNDYTVTVTYGILAQLPEDVTLSVRELLPDTEEYNEHMGQLFADYIGNIYDIRLFDITFLSESGEEIEPVCEVDMQILYDNAMELDENKQVQVLHFDKEEGLEMLPANPVEDENGVIGVEYGQDSFSVSAILTTDVQTQQNDSTSTIDDTNMPWIQIEDTSASTNPILQTDPVVFNDLRNTWFSSNSTQFAGGVRTDKSVTTGTITYSDGYHATGTIQRKSSDTFLVALSTLASTQSVLGKTSAPTDVMFILDMSSSMYSQGGTSSVRDKTTVEKMIDALNNAMDRLYDLNVNNRFGVIVYWGHNYVDVQSNTSYSKVLLPLGRYRHNENSKYFELMLASDGKLNGIRVTNNVVDEKNSAKMSQDTYKHTILNGQVYGTDSYVAGTYAQLGILKAKEQFLSATTTTTDNKARRPVFVFMSDGAPTAATTTYSQISDAQMGFNREKAREAVQSDFVTQLTAAYAKEEVKIHYEESTAKGAEPLYYTLGLHNGSNLSMDILNPNQQNTNEKNAEDIYTHDGCPTNCTCRTLYNPDGSAPNDTINITQQIRQQWTDLINSTDDKITLYTHTTLRITNVNNVQIGYLEDGVARTVSKVTLSNNTQFPSSIEQQNYVDEYYDAPSADKLQDAFNDIVLDISLQDAFHPTYVESQQVSQDGEVSFIDDIGDYMEVKEVKGLLLDGKLYSGAELSRNFSANGFFGSVENPEQMGVQFVFNVAEQISGTALADDAYANKDKNYVEHQKYLQFVDIIDMAYRVGQLSYDEQSGKYSNYIAWKAGANNQFLGFYHEEGKDCTRTGTGCEHPEHYTITEDVNYVIKSYFYFGDVAYDDHDEGIIKYADMMYATIWVREEKTQMEDGTYTLNGDQTVVFSLPASILPTVDYEIGLDQNHLPIRFRINKAIPAMLVYEVGLRDDFDVSNIDPNYKGQYQLNDNGAIIEENGEKKLNDNGRIYFYTNEYERDQLTGYGKTNTYSYFRPGIENFRYYFTEDTPLLVKQGDGYVEYNGTTTPKNPKDPTDVAYYRAYHYYAVEDGVIKQKVDYKDITDNVFDTDENGALKYLAQRADGVWYVKKGTPRGLVTTLMENGVYVAQERFEEMKSVNKTGTLNMLTKPYVDLYSQNVQGSFIVGATLGNNGRLYIEPQRLGLSGTKTLIGLENISNYKFDFNLYKTDADFVVDSESPLVETVQNNGSEIKFSDVYLKYGTHYFVVNESAKDGFICDTAEYRVTVTIPITGAPTVTVKKGEVPASANTLDFTNTFHVELPSTGGIGTAVYQWSGAIVILLAVVLLFITKRRYQSNE